MPSVTINGRVIGPGRPVYIIAEAGVNHNGDPILARRLVDAASDAGADAVKFQTFRAEDLVTAAGDMAAYQKKNLGTSDSQLAMLKKLELKETDFTALKEYCDTKGILFLSTPHTPGAAVFLNGLVPAFKLGSGDLTNLPFLRQVAAYGKPIILGTGMATLDEVRETLATLYGTGNRQVVMLHCTTSYPCPVSDVNLAAMQTMIRELDCLVGYSDHTEGCDVTPMAAALGAVVIEKHFTLDRTLPGPDHKASLDPAELTRLVAAIKNGSNMAVTPEVLGSPIKQPTAAERVIAPASRKSVVTAIELSAGTVLAATHLVIKRPGTGIRPGHLEKLYGKTVKNDLPKDTVLQWDDLKDGI